MNLVTGALIRAHEGRRLRILPDEKLINKFQAVESVQRMADIIRIETVIPGDGWPVFKQLQESQTQLSEEISTDDHSSS